MFAPKIAQPEVMPVAEATRQPAPDAQEAVREGATVRVAEPSLSRDFSRIPVQTKLSVGSIDDPLEHEADRVADQVMRMAAPSPVASAGTTVQRKCAACEEEEEAETIRTKRDDGRAASGEAPAVVSDVLRSAGTPLDAEARAFFEPRFGRDFSQVRIHSDARAASSAQSIGARAYTVGRHIAFASGQYAPGSSAGRHLLAHELAHTIQQGAARIRRQADGDVKSPRERLEEEAPAGEASATTDQMVQRSTKWNGATVHETVSPAETIFGADAPVSWQQLNGKSLKSDADADAAIKEPTITTQELPTKDVANKWAAAVDTVPLQEGSDDETVLKPGPWTKLVTKVQAGNVTGLAACKGAGNSTFTRKGNPDDDSVYKANRRHEDKHVEDDKLAFEETIGKWDKNLEDAKTAKKMFTAASGPDATAKLWAAMGDTPKKTARAYNQSSLSKGEAFHKTAKGGPMGRSNPVSNADCSTSGMDVTNPS